MSFTWPIDKLGIINRALAATGNNLVAVADDGSDEWNTCSPAYDAAIAYMIENHSWGFAKKVITLTPSNVAPLDTDWDTQFPIPADVMHITWVKINQDTTSATSNTQANLLLYSIYGSPTGPMLMVNAQGGPPPPNPPVIPGVVTMQYISNSGPLSDAQSGTPTFVVALQRFVMEAIYRGIHEDTGEARAIAQEARMMLSEARTKYDQQKPKRQFWNSRITASRRLRRPWPQIGTGDWGAGGGSGSPG